MLKRDWNFIETFSLMKSESKEHWKGPATVSAQILSDINLGNLWILSFLQFPPHYS